MKLRVYCPAKVNLFLAVGPRDSRGYHPLRTIFQAVGLYDILDVAFGSSGETTVEIVGADLPENNTVTKALRLSHEVFAIKPSHIRLEKHIPMQSGLGGGSSDAAGLLRALNYVRAVPLQEIEAIASAVGADVPFFLTGGRAKGKRYGDRITPMEDAPVQWLVIAKPEVGCSTVEMYSKLDENEREGRDWPEGDLLYNDFERVAPCECLDLIEKVLSLGAEDAALSGSGSCVFGRFKSQAAADGAKARVGCQAWVVKTLTRTESLRIEEI